MRQVRPRATNARRAGLSAKRIGVDEAVALSTLLRVLAHAYSYPDKAMIKAVRAGFAQALDDCERGLLPLRTASAVKSASLAWRGTSFEMMGEDYSRLFIGSGPVRLREGNYADGLRFAGQPFDLADIGGFYLAFGFGPPPEAASPPDHIGTELEFVSLLYLKLASAIERRNHEQVNLTQSAIASFITDHLGRWTDALSLSLRDSGAIGCYRTLGELTSRVVLDICNRSSARPVPATQGAIVDPVQQENLVCPLAAGQAPGAESA